MSQGAKTILTDEQLREAYPQIPWEKPMPVTVVGMQQEGDRYVCRYCVAQKGLRASDMPKRGMMREECIDHIRQAHPTEAQSA